MSILVVSTVIPAHFARCFLQRSGLPQSLPTDTESERGQMPCVIMAEHPDPRMTVMDYNTHVTPDTNLQSDAHGVLPPGHTLHRSPVQRSRWKCQGTVEELSSNVSRKETQRGIRSIAITLY